ncbi:MAG: sodium:proton antiporter [Planctomycetota bacterium]|nr:sodium:proton antiporter [Planctomycetota bacterium]
MRKVLLFSVLLLAGMVLSQVLPRVIPADAAGTYRLMVTLLTMTALSFIMIHVGYEFEIDKRKMGQYGVDAMIACTAATFPWILCAGYFVMVLAPREAWTQPGVLKESLLAGCFSAPTSAGILFSMLAAAGLSATWLFLKARILAIFDDLFVVLLMIPLKMMMVGVKWQLGVIVVIMAALLWAAWTFLHRVRIPITWRWVLGYSVVIVAVLEAVHMGSKVISKEVPIHIEVLLPAFVLGCVMARPAGARPHSDDAVEGHLEGPENPEEQRVSTIISACFMVLVGLSMPTIPGLGSAAEVVAPGAVAGPVERLSDIPMPSWGMIAVHVLAMTVLSNLGKMFPALCYRSEATLRERLALAIGLFPRGEVGAGVLVIALGYGIGGPALTIAVLSLALNLVLTGLFIVVIKKLIAPR